MENITALGGLALLMLSPFLHSCYSKRSYLLLASLQKLNSDLELKPIIGCGCSEEHFEPLLPNKSNDDFSTILLFFFFPLVFDAFGSVGVESYCYPLQSFSQAAISCTNGHSLQQDTSACLANRILTAFDRIRNSNVRRRSLRKGLPSGACSLYIMDFK